MRAETLDIKGRRVRFWRGGIGPPLVLLQGGMADAELHWAPVWDALGERFDVIAPDWPGFGGSEPLVGASFAQMCDWLVAFQDAVVGEPLRLVGNSFGGTIARLFDGLYPAKVSSIVILNGGGLPSAELGKSLAAADLDGDGLVSAGRIAFSREALARMVADPATLSEGFVAACQSNPIILRILRDALTQPLPPPTASASRTLVLWGEADQHTPIDVGRQVAASIPGAGFIAIERAGHLPQIENPAAIVAALEAFLLDET